MFKSIMLIVGLSFLMSACNLDQTKSIPTETPTNILPDIQIKTPDYNVVPCEFNPFGIGGDIEVYSSPNLNLDPIHSIQMGTTYSVLGADYQTDNTDNRLFYHLDFGDFSGWVIAIRGELIGDCESYR